MPTNLNYPTSRPSKVTYAHFSSLENSNYFPIKPELPDPVQEIMFFGNLKITIPVLAGLYAFGSIGPSPISAINQTKTAKEYVVSSVTNKYHTQDATTTEWMFLSINSGAYDFWKQPEENIYTEEDGTPV